MSALHASHLENRGILCLDGEDRHSFLQGLISNDINLAAGDKVIYAAMLTPQGKFLHDLFIYNRGEEFLIDTEADRIGDLMRLFTKYKLRAKIAMKPQLDLHIWGVWDDEDNNLSAVKKSHSDGITYADPRLPELGIRVIMQKGSVPMGAAQKQFTSYDRHRLKLGVADGARDMRIENSALTEGNFDLLNGISFSKGCYVGQELTARMHYRGLAKKRMFPVSVEGNVPRQGCYIEMDGGEIGEMRSSAGDAGLALLNVEKALSAIATDTPLACSETRIRVHKPDWMKLKDDQAG
jgi:folate-binding protein YgfZ